MSGPRHRVLVVGVGSIGERHLRCFAATGRAELAFVEVRDDLRQGIAGRYAIERAYSDLETAKEFPPQVAVIATPAPFHVSQARLLVEHGVHVLIEKPLSVGVEGVAELRARAEARGTVVGVAYVLRCQPVLAGLRQALAERRFGAPVELIVVAGQHFPTYRPAYRDIYYARHATGGGAIQDALTHLVNVGEWLLGPIDRLVADAGHLVLEGVEVEDTVHLLARHGRVLGSYALNQHQAPNETTITVVCERGTLRAELHASRWGWQEMPEGGWHDETFPARERDALFIDQAHAFLDAVEGKRPVSCSLDEGLHTLRVNLAALRSVQSRAWEVVGGE